MISRLKADRSLRGRWSPAEADRSFGVRWSTT